MRMGGTNEDTTTDHDARLSGDGDGGDGSGFGWWRECKHLYESGWDCADVGAGIHCSRVPLGDFLSGQVSGKSINVMVLDGVEGAFPGDGAFLGTEILRISSNDISENTCWKGGETWHNLVGDVYACHHWQGGTPPA